MTKQLISKLPPEFQKQVREACKHYKKPERIGKLPLAGVALQAILLQEPTYKTTLEGRGEALRQVIRDVLEQMKPPHLTAQALSQFEKKPHREGQIHLCLYCYVLDRDPYSATPITSVEAYLESSYGIPRATYFHRQKEGLKRLGYELTTYLAERTTWIEPVPSSPKGYIGREAELSYYQAQFDAHGVVAIEGVGGIGKTTLGAELANSIQRPLCWLTLRAGLNDAAMALLHAWAVFLAQHDYPQLWAFMRATAIEEKNLVQFFPLLRQGLAKVKPLLCVDNLELLSEGDQESWALLEMVLEESEAGLLLISQQRPQLARLGDYSLLSGLSSAQVQDFMQQHQIELTQEQAETVRRETLGNPRLLVLWLAYLRLLEFDLAESLAKLQRSQAVSYFLANEVVAALADGPKRAAQLLALSRRPLDGFLLQNLSEDLPPLSGLHIEPASFKTLSQLGLIHENRGEQWTLSPLLSGYLAGEMRLADQSFSNEAMAFHEWLAHLYISQGTQVEAAYHAMQAGEIERAVMLLAAQKELLLQEGYATQMSELLSPIEADKLSATVREVLRQLRITLWKLLGDYDAAEAEANAAAHDAITTAAKAQSERTLGTLSKKRGNLWQATDHYQQALRLLATEEMNLEAWLHRDLAWGLAEQNNLDEAWDEAQRARIATEYTLGLIAWRRAKVEQALQHYHQAAIIAQECNELRQLMRVQNNLAIAYWGKKDFKQAIGFYEKNLTLTEEISELVGKAITLMNLGVCHTQIGLDEPQKAIDYFRQALPTFSTLGDTKGQMLANFNLAEQYQRLCQLDEAHQHIEAAISVDKRIVPTTSYAEAQRIYAEILLAQNKRNDALAAGQEALATLQLDDQSEITDPLYAKLACETLARIHKARGEMAEAENYEKLAGRLQEQLG